MYQFYRNIKWGVPIFTTTNNRQLYGAVYVDNSIPRAQINYYPGFSLTALAFQDIFSCQVSIHLTWVECGKCRLMACKRTLVPCRGSNHDFRISSQVLKPLYYDTLKDGKEEVRAS